LINKTKCPFWKVINFLNVFVLIVPLHIYNVRKLF
jgi:hypothetical protein